MGPSPLTPRALTSLPSVMCRDATTFTTIALRSLEDQRGVFDVPSGQNPPESSRRSLGSVRGWPSSYASFSSKSDLPTPPSSPVCSSNGCIKDAHPGFVDQKASSENSPPSGSRGQITSTNSDHIPRKDLSGIPHSLPRTIPNSGHPQRKLSQGYERTIDDLVTPPLTPDSSPFGTHASLTKNRFDTAAFDILARLFPGSARTALPYTKTVRITSSELALESSNLSAGFAFEGIILDMPGQLRTLYIDGKGAESVKLKESIVALLELADEHLNCAALVIFIERNSAALRNLLHSFMYAGATVVKSSPFTVDDTYVLIGFEI